MSIATPSYFGPLHDESAFQVPMPGLFADVDAGAASVALTDEFLELPAEIRVSILQQWLRGCTAQRDAALVEMFREFADSVSRSTIIQQIESFRQHCGVHGVACPTDFAVLLQRY